MRVFKSIKIITCCTLLCSSSTFAMSGLNAKLQTLADNYVKVNRDNEHISTITLGVRRAEELNTAVYAGSTSFDNNTPVTENNLFSIGSITKSFVAAIILQLESDPANHFSIDDPIDNILPEYPAWHQVTARELMNMTSGIPDYIFNMGFIFKFMKDPYREWKPNELTDISYKNKKPLNFTPGTQWEYSNVNFVILGMMVERITGHSIGDEINGRMIVPHSLTKTYFIPHKPTDSIHALLVREYFYTKSLGKFMKLGTDVRDYSTSYMGATGAMISTAPDIMHWVHELFTPNHVLSSYELSKLTTLVSIATAQPIKDVTADDTMGYGLGIFRMYIPEAGGATYAYGGHTLGGRAFYIYNEQNDACVVATANSSIDLEDYDHYETLLKTAYSYIAPNKGISSAPVNTKIPVFANI